MTMVQPALFELGDLCQRWRDRRQTWQPAPTGNWRAGQNGRGARRLDLPMPTLTTRECDGIAVPPLTPPTGWESLFPGQRIEQLGQSMLPFVTTHRGGGDRNRARPATEPVSTLSANGNHHGLAFPPDLPDDEMTSWAHQLLVPYFGNSTTCHPATRPVGTLTTRDSYGLARCDDFDALGQQAADLPDLTKVPMARLRELLAPVRFRMLTKKEASKTMGFDDTMQSAKPAAKWWQLLIGNSVAVPCGELIASALFECSTGETLARDLSAGELVSA